MRCDLGDHEAGHLYLLSIPGLPPFGCIGCLRQRGLWCEQHQRVFNGFVDGTSACFICIEEEVGRSEAVGAQFLPELESILPDDEREELNDWLTTSATITGQSRERCFVRTLASKALRTNTPLAAVVEMIRARSSIVPIFT